MIRGDVPGGIDRVGGYVCICKVGDNPTVGIRHY